MSIRNKLSLIFALTTLVIVVVTAIAYVWVDRLARNSLTLAENARPLQIAANEMEINVHETALSVFAYVFSGDVTTARKERIRDSLDDFAVYWQSIRDHAESNEVRALADQVAVQFREFTADIDHIIQESDLIRSGRLTLRGFVAEVDESLDEELDSILDMNSAANLEKIKAALKMEINAFEIFQSISEYIAEPDYVIRARFEKDISDFQEHRADYGSTAVSAAEQEWLTRLDTRMAKSIELGRELMRRWDNVESLLTIMEADLTDIEDLLDDKLQPIVNVWVAALREDSQEIRTNADIALIFAGFFAATFAVSAAVYAKRTIVAPIGRLAEAAAEIGRGHFSVTVPREGDDEIGVLARTMWQMLENLKETTVRRSHHYVILSSLSESVVVVSPDGLIISANQSTLDLTGYSELDLTGLPLGDLVKGTEFDFSALHSKNITPTLQGLEATYRAKDGREISMLAAVSPMTDESGAVESIVVTAVDNSVQHEARMKLARSNEELERFAYIASHDLQEPLRMVSSFTQLLQQKYSDELDSDARDYITFAADGAQRMRDLIGDLLAYSRVGRTDRPLVSVDCTAALEVACANLAVCIEETGAKITWSDLPRVRGDARLLTSLFQNLLSNAIKYRREVGPEIAVSANGVGSSFEIAVKDNGIGIEAQYLTKIFEPFKRLHSRDKYQGTGIGLAICTRIAELHGGRIWAESTPGVGTTVFFTLQAASGVEDGESNNKISQYIAG